MNYHSKNYLKNYLFLLPALLFLTVSMIIPFVLGFKISFTNWNGVSPDMDYVGLKNFINIFSNKEIIKPIVNTLYYAITLTVFDNFLALMLALALNRPLKGRGFLRMIYFMPTALNAVLAVFIFSFVYREVFSVLFGMNSFLGNTKTVIPGIILIVLWNSVGINMVIYLSALAGVPNSLYDAAMVDGANRFNKFFNVTLPMIIPSFTICITLTLTYSLREFAMPMIATGGGPARSSETIAIYIYNHLFAFSKAGYGQAIALLLMIFLILVGVTLSRIFRKREVEL